MLTTPFCRMLGIDHPVLCAGMGAAAGPDLAAAVSNAGGLGVFGASGSGRPWLEGLIARTRSLTARPFGVNVILDTMRAGQIEACLDARVPVLVLFWGDPTPYVADAHARGMKIFVQVGSVDEAAAAARAGVDAVIAQGVEAGGHVRGTTALTVLVPAVVEAVHPVPVIASGGIATGRGLLAALALGAQAASVGTRFLASPEAFVLPEYRDRLLVSQAADAVYTMMFDIGWPNAPHRVLRNKAVEEWEAAGQPPSGERPGEGTTIGTGVRGGEPRDVPRYASFTVTADFQGDIEYASLWAGQSCGLVRDVKPAGEIVRALVREAEEALEAITTWRGR